MSEPACCLFTITTDSFIPGTLVLLRSFARHNRWFHGDVVLIADEIADESRRQIDLASDRVRVQRSGPELVAHVDRLVAAFPDAAPVRSHFSSLEAFTLRGYDKVIYCDSDLLFRGSIENLIRHSDALVACGDVQYYRSGGHSFNAGLMVIDKQVLTDDCYRGLLDHVCPKTFETRRIAHTDQAVLNAYFQSAARIASGADNYLLACHEDIAAAEGTPLSKARVLHFNFGRKPWMPDEALRTSIRDPIVAAACGMWLDEFAACLEEAALRRVLQTPAGLRR
jgi:hypothetical protein